MPREVSIHGLGIEDAWTFGETFTAPVERASRRWADDIARAELGRGAG